LSSLQFNIDAPEEAATYFANVALPLPIPQLFTYRIPTEFLELVKPGIRVIVSFGRQKVVTGLVDSIHQEAPKVYTAKPILDVLDAEPVVTPQQVNMMKWMSNYYLCTYGEVVNAAFPSGLKLSSESKIQLHPHYDWNDTDLTLDDKEVILLSALEKKDSLSYRDAADILELKSAYRYIKSLVQKELVIIYEEVKERYKPKKVKKIRLHGDYLADEGLLDELFQELEKKPKQSDILLLYLREVPLFQNPELNSSGIPKSAFTEAGLSASSIKTMVKNEILIEFEEIVSRFGDEGPAETTEIELSDIQQNAQQEIFDYFTNKSTVLLHGITGSGKTETYISLIQQALESGQQVLYLLPEIALTAQIVNRLRKVFGDRMGVYHSKFSDNERVEVWYGLMEGRFDFIVGVRSSIFLPFASLGLVIVDEEHETSYKQYDPAPRYHARDVALYLAHLHGAKTVLGSATPSLESYTNAKQEKYGLVELFQRYNDASLPVINLANLTEEKKRKTSVGEFTSVLIEAIGQILEKKEQAIIFQNRRGFSNYLTCEDCGYIPECPRCSVSLTYHQYKNQLNCHYCGHKDAVPLVCPACGSTKVHTVGIGTERIEEDIKLLFPKARVQRMDLETTRAKYAYQNIIHDFEKGEIDILVGTQMVSKGLDFDKVSLVGVFDIDRMLYFPDFRAYERAFQMVTQVSGRAGRRDTEGKVIIQSRNPEQGIIELIKAGDYHTFYQREMMERKKYHYPPFTRMIHLTLRSKDKKLTNEAAQRLANILKEDMGASRVLGPQEPLINKIRDKFLMDIFLKIEKKYKMEAVKDLIRNAQLELLKVKELKSVEVVVDVDPH